MVYNKQTRNGLIIVGATTDIIVAVAINQLAQSMNSTNINVVLTDGIEILDNTDLSSIKPEKSESEMKIYNTHLIESRTEYKSCKEKRREKRKLQRIRRKY